MPVVFRLLKLVVWAFQTCGTDQAVGHHDSPRLNYSVLSSAHSLALRKEQQLMIH